MRLIAASLCALALAPAAFAERFTDRQPYFDVALSLGMPATETVRNTSSGNPDNDPGTIDLSVASGFGIAAAYGFASAGRLRGIEFELGYYRAGTDDFSTPDGYPIVWETGNPNNYETTAPALGDVATTSFMVNTYGEFGEGGSSPYLGAGLGVALHQVDVTTDVGILKRGLITTVTDEAVVFAWQVMAGITYKGARLGYRYFATADADIDGLELTHGRHSIELGVTFH